MIIYGTRTMNSTEGISAFHCPRCGGQREGKIQSANRWFTLYFIPVIPMGSAGRYVECTACAGTYATEILNYDPAAEQAALAVEFRRMLAMVLLASGRTQPKYVEAVQNACFDVFEINVPIDEIHADLRMAQDARAELRPYLQLKAGDLSANGKKLLVRVAAQILSAAGPMHESDKGVVRQIGETIGVPAPYVESALVAEPLLDSPS
jgi:uncharacterized tellurite resistance protein B-like protein